MKMTFSQRMGFKPVRSAFQVDAMDDNLRNSLWNNFYDTPIRSEIQFSLLLWKDFFKKPLFNDLMLLSIEEHIQEIYFKLKWYEVYDFIEFVANIFPKDRS